MKTQANAEGLEQTQLIDKKPADHVEQMLLNESQKINTENERLEDNQTKADELLQKNQSEIQQHTQIKILGLNKLDKEKN